MRGREKHGFGVCGDGNESECRNCLGRHIGALHTRLVPGFVVHTEVEPGARVVTFANGMQVREPFIDLDETKRRLVWSAEGAAITHYNASVRHECAQNGSSEAS